MIGPATDAVWLERARGFHPDRRMLALSGLEQLEGFFDGRVLPPPIHYLCGLTLTAAAPGTATFTLPASAWLVAPQGMLTGSTLALLADAPLGCASQSLLPPGTPYTTAEMSLSFVRPVTPGSGLLTGVAEATHAGRTLGLSTVTMTDGQGRDVAYGSCRIAILPRMDVPAGVEAELRADPPRPTEPDWPSTHPFLRPPVGAMLDAATLDGMTGLEMLRRQITGDLPRPPISVLTGLRVTEAGEGTSMWTMPATPWLQSPVPGRLYGGSIAHLAGTAVEGAIQTLAASGRAVAGTDLKVYFLRPVRPDGAEMTARGTVVHRGRTQAVASADVVDVAGRRVAMAVGAALLRPVWPPAGSRAAADAEELPSPPFED